MSSSQQLGSQVVEIQCTTRFYDVPEVSVGFISL